MIKQPEIDDGELPEPGNDHFVEFAITGPPGTGKTTWLARQARLACEKHNPDKVLITSLTRAAAAEIAGRDTPIPRNNIGTLHSLCFRSLGSPIIAETRFHEFNADFPQFRLSTDHVKGEDSEVEAPGLVTQGDKLLSEVNLLRQQMIPVERYAEKHKMFIKRYSEWKVENELLDFTDLIERALDDVLYAPGRPTVLLGDECQDWSLLETNLMRKWGMETETFIRVGDPDQAIYEWRGADPDTFRRSNIPSENRRILKQSYRVPRAVHELAIQWIKQITERDDIEYLPTVNEGRVTFGSGSYRTPESFIDEIVKRIDAGQSVMVLGTCAYMLEPLKMVLKRLGVPFHNPYRKTRGDWNPLRHGRGVSATERLFAFLSEHAPLWQDEARRWTWQDLKRWTKIVNSKQILAHGAKKQIEDADKEGSPTIDELCDLFRDSFILGDLVRKAAKGDHRVYLDMVTPANRPRFDYIKAVIDRHSFAGLTDTPKLTIGTVHSVKGGEADAVFLFPDLSQAGMLQWITQGRGHDGIVRLMYVAMTRARNEIVLLQPASDLNIGSLK